MFDPVGLGAPRGLRHHAPAKQQSTRRSHQGTTSNAESKITFFLTRPVKANSGKGCRGCILEPCYSRRAFIPRNSKAVSLLVHVLMPGAQAVAA